MNALEYLTTESLEQEYRATKTALRQALKYLTDIELEMLRRGGRIGYIPDAERVEGVRP